MPVIRTNEITPGHFLPKIFVRMAHSENNTFSLTTFEKGAVSPKHKHPMEEVLIILEGGGDFFIDKDIYGVGKGDIVILPPLSLHQFTPTADCSAIEIFHPKLTPEIIKILQGGGAGKDA